MTAGKNFKSTNLDIVLIEGVYTIFSSELSLGFLKIFLKFLLPLINHFIARYRALFKERLTVSV